MKVYLLRHGQSVANKQKWLAGQTATKLTTQGKHQAQEFARRHQEQFKDATLISSTLPRAYQTAETIAPFFGVDQNEIITSQLCVERGFGKFEGQPKTEMRQKAAPSVVKQERESLASLRDRALAFAEELREHQPPILVVSHHGFIRMMRQLATNPENWQQAMNQPRVENLGLVEVDLARIPVRQAAGAFRVITR